MRRSIWGIVASFVCLSCWSDAERLPPPLPQDGTALPYSQVTSRLSAQTNSAKDAHFLNQWDTVVDVSLQLEQSAGYLMRSPDLAEAQRPRVQKIATDLKTNIVKLRETARAKDQAESLECIRRIHNSVRDLQDVR